MAVVEIASEVDRFVLYFKTPRPEINAYALASTLVNLSDAIHAANAAVNPGYRVEVVVEGLSGGSFKATVRTVFETAKNIFSHEAAKAIIYGIISTHIYETVIKTETPPKIIVSQDVVIVESGNDKIIVPKDVYEAKKAAEKSPRFTSSIGKVFESAASDPSVEGIGLSPTMIDTPPPVYVPREKFALIEQNPSTEETSREIVEAATLVISRAILERGNRKWEFYWRGFKISAPVLDSRFYDRFFAHEIMIAPGDALKVTLRVFQEQNPDTGIFINTRYEVSEVFEHIPRLKQTAF